jgi:hypothetical protein
MRAYATASHRAHSADMRSEPVLCIRDRSAYELHSADEARLDLALELLRMSVFARSAGHQRRLPTPKTQQARTRCNWVSPQVVEGRACRRASSV